MWLAMVILHTVAAIACFAVGVAALSPARARRQPWLLTVFLLSLVAMLVFMVGAMASHWDDLEAVAQAVFSGLVLLAVFMSYRAFRARAAVDDRSDPRQARYMDDVSFVLISLFNGFVIVAAIDLGAPGWAVAAIAIAAVVLGARAKERAKARAGLSR